MKLLTITLLLLLNLSGCSHFTEYKSDAIVTAKLIKKPKLIYPVAAQIDDRSGTSIILMEISDKGNVEKTLVFKSSGYTDLDNAAMEYCNGLKFAPALKNGNPIPTSMKYQIKFDLADFSKEVVNNIEKVNRIYTLLENMENDQKYKFQTDILNIHTSMIEMLNDGRKFNEYMYAVVNDNLRIVWEENTDNYPLTFLLYHDFIERFGDYDSLEVVKNMLKNSLERDVEYLINGENLQKDFNFNKEKLIDNILSFVKENYPEIRIDVSGIAESFKNNNIS